jgi:hypothetical protein
LSLCCLHSPVHQCIAYRLWRSGFLPANCTSTLHAVRIGACGR